MTELEKLETLPSLVELSVVSNPVSVLLFSCYGNKIRTKVSKKLVTSALFSNILPVSKEWKHLGMGNIRESRKYEQDCIVCAETPYPWLTSSAFSSASLVAFFVEARANKPGENQKGINTIQKTNTKKI